MNAAELQKGQKVKLMARLGRGPVGEVYNVMRVQRGEVWLFQDGQPHIQLSIKDANRCLKHV